MTTDDRSVGLEIRVGLAVIGVLTVVLSWAVARRLLRTSDAPPAAIESDRPFTTVIPPPAPEPQPMILPRSDRYTGPATFIEPRPLTPIEPAAEGTATPPDLQPSLLPALPEANHPGQATGIKAQRPGVANPLRGHADAVRSDRPAAAAGRVGTPAETIQRTAGVTPSRLPPAIPGKPEVLPLNHTSLRPGEKYLVEEGDTLAIIAQFELGDANRWPEILYLNRELLKRADAPPRPGTWIVLPAAMASGGR